MDDTGHQTRYAQAQNEWYIASIKSTNKADKQAEGYRERK